MRRPEEVFVLVRRGDDWLVLHRAPAKGAYWHCVAGALEPGEDWAGAAVRELDEETGLAAEPLDLDHEYAYPVDEDPAYRDVLPSGTEEIRVRAFLAEAPSGWEPTLDAEHDGYCWCSPEAAAELLFWPEPGNLLRTLAS